MYKMVTKFAIFSSIKQSKTAKNISIQTIDNNIKQNNPAFAKIANLDHILESKIIKKINNPNKIYK